MAQRLHGKAPTIEMGHIANQITALPVAPAADPQKREIVAKLNELASQMKQWAVQVEGFASLLNSFSIIPGQGPSPTPHPYPHPESSSDGALYASRGAPNGQASYPQYPTPSQQYTGSQHSQFQVLQYQGRQLDGASYPPGQLPPENSPTMLTTSMEGSERYGKRRRKTDGQRRKKDPLAPKRPPSAYILYQNDVRKQMQDKYPELPYSDVLGKISESWQTLEEGRKKVYLDAVERDKVRYEDEKLRYNMGQDVPTKPTPRRPLAALRAPSDPEIDAEVEGEEGQEEVEGAERDDLEPDAKRTRLAETGESYPDVPANPSLSYLQLQPVPRTTSPQQDVHSPDPSSHGYSHPHTPAQPATPVVTLSQPLVHPLQPAVYNPQLSRHATPQSVFPPGPPSQASHPSTPASLAAHHSPQLSHVSPQMSPHQAHIQLQYPGHPMPHLTQVTGASVPNVGSASKGGVGQPSQL